MPLDMPVYLEQRHKFLANRAAFPVPASTVRSLITITEQTTAPPRVWHVHYGPRDYIHRRGGDLTVVVDEAGTVQRILRGQCVADGLHRP